MDNLRPVVFLTNFDRPGMSWGIDSGVVVMNLESRHVQLIELLPQPEHEGVLCGDKEMNPINLFVCTDQVIQVLTYLVGKSGLLIR